MADALIEDGPRTTGPTTRSEARMERPAEEFRDDLIDRLKDLRYCAKNLSAASRDSAETFLAAMRNVVEAQKSMSTVASETGVDRVNL